MLHYECQSVAPGWPLPQVLVTPWGFSYVGLLVLYLGFRALASLFTQQVVGGPALCGSLAYYLTLANLLQQQAHRRHSE